VHVAITTARPADRNELRDECLNEHWFPSLLHAGAEIERWRRRPDTRD
jgi:hypothetical protein